MRELKSFPFKNFADKFHDGIMNNESYYFYLYFITGYLGFNSPEEVMEIIDKDDYGFRDIKE